MERQIEKVLCVCMGNGDRSPLLAAILKMFLQRTGHYDVIVESAGTLQMNEKGGPASAVAVTAGRQLGLDISDHNRRYVKALDLDQYDLFICMDDGIAGELVGMGVDLKKIFNVQVSNAWPIQFDHDFEPTVVAILGAVYRVVTRYFPPVK